MPLSSLYIRQKLDQTLSLTFEQVWSLIKQTTFLDPYCPSKSGSLMSLDLNDESLDQTPALKCA
jgi:hypothetical protein